MSFRFCLLACALFLSSFSSAQTPARSDTLKPQTLAEIRIRAQRETIQRLPSVQGTYLWSGKKNEVINLENTEANIAEKTPRQVFAKIPGVFVYDMDGTGNQTNISTRGLDPHRGWEFNIRTDGIGVNSDLYGYPASHFSLPMEAIRRIEIVRGTGALQYGAQFGGMLNYVLKQPDTTRQLGFESTNSVGTYGLMSTYAALGGKSGKWEYCAFYSRRTSAGYRQNSETNYDGEGAMLKFSATPRLSFKATMLRSNYLYHIPGPLTDAMFEADPRQSTRSRNYFNPEIYVPAFATEWLIAPRTRLTWTASAVLGDRRSVLFDRPANIRDTINLSTGQYAGRQVDVDHFNSYTTELRLLHEYVLLGQKSALAAGAQVINNDLHRQQQGKGTSGTDFDLSISAAGWGRDIHFKTQNVAFFAENKFQLTPRLSVSPGFRVEMGTSKMSGSISYLPPLEIPNTIERRFPLFGANAEYQLSTTQNFYAGWSQAYRPVIFKDIVPANFYERADKNLKDAFGYNLEFGWRGAARGFKWDIGAFSLLYRNRLGTLAQYSAELDTVILFRTNVGDSRTNGLEIFGEYGFRLGRNLSANIFTSTSYFDAHYLDGAAIRVSPSENRSIAGNRVESVPAWISRNGLTVKYKSLSVMLLYSYTAESFADPLNTQTPNASGAVGLVPAYALFDLNAALRLSSQITIRLSVNNLTNRQYFTKRPLFYPGPGIWPSDGRGAVLAVTLRV